MAMRKSFVKATAVLLATGMVSTLLSGTGAEAAAKKTVKLNKSKTSIVVGKKWKAKVKPSKGVKVKSVKWSVNKKGKKFIKLSSKKKTGVTIKGVKKGTATVTAKIKTKIGKKSKTFTKKIKVTVKAKPKTTTTQKPTDSTSVSTQKPSDNTSTGQTSAPTTTPAPTQNAGNQVSASDTDKTSLKYNQFDMKDVTVTDEYFANSLSLENKYLIKLDENKLLAGFKENAAYAAGMSAQERTAYMNGVTRYNTGTNSGAQNWENTLIAGHTLGHYMSAIAQAVTNPGTSAADKEKLQAKIDNIVATLKDCQSKTQNSSVCKKGYIFGAVIKNTNNLELQFDNVEKNRVNIITEAWVPWYTMHKILAGLVEIYEMTGDEDALAVAEELGEWTYQRVSQWSDSTRSTVLAIEYGGMNDALYELAKCTTNTTYQDHFIAAAKQFDEDVAVPGQSKSLFKKVYDGDKNCLDNQHANTTIPKFLGALNRYIALTDLGKLTEDDKIYLEYAKRFWDMVVNHHAYITGGSSEWEHFGKDDVLNGERTHANNETCNTYNMLKMSRELYKITGEKKYVDYYENVMINSIMASQNPETGMSMYWQPMATGFFKVYSTETDNFWCCTGSGMENFTKLNDSIYYHKENDVVVDQYRSSVLNWKLKNLKLTQEADFLKGTTQKFTINTLDGTNAKVDVNLKLRIPDYAAGKATVKVNGTAYNYEESNEYAVVKGAFDNGTIITIDIPVKVVAYNLPDSETTYGFKYGPFVLSARLGKENMTTGSEGVGVTTPKTKLVESENVIVDYDVEGGLEEYIRNIDQYFKKTTLEDGTLAFNMTKTDQALTFIPYYLEHTNRYGIYWNFPEDEDSIAAAQVMAAKTKARDAKYLGVVQAGYGQNEVDALHDLQEENSESQTSNGSSRWAKAGGYFSYRMEVTDADDMTLICQFDKADNGKTIKISIGDTEIANETLDYTGDDNRYKKFFTIPKEAITQAVKEEYTDDSGEKHTLAKIRFESAKTDEQSAALCDEAYTYKKLNSVAELDAVTSGDETITPDGKTYELTIPADAKSAAVTFTLKDTKGYVTLDGKPVADAVAKTIDMGSKRKETFDVRVYAEDFDTHTDYKLVVKKTYEFDENIEYFVDCGDFNVTTVSSGDKLGRCNSVTEQVYGEDPITGKKWGVVDEVSTPLLNGTSNKTEDAAYTDHTWPFETDASVTDGVAKERTNRYTKNQFEDGIAIRYLDYAFELENGSYDVEVGFSNPWMCSDNPILYANLDAEDESKSTLSEGVGVPDNGVKTVKGTVTVTNGKLTLNARSKANDGDTLAINMTYIIIKKHVEG